MITSKERAALRTQANTLQTTLIVGKGGISQSLISEAEKLLDAKELVKGTVLESALLTAREACNAICEATKAEGIQVVGNKFVIWRKSEKQEEKKSAKPTVKKPNTKKVNPVKAGIQKRRNQAKENKKRREEYFHEAAVKAAIERRKQREEH